MLISIDKSTRIDDLFSELLKAESEKLNTSIKFNNKLIEIYNLKTESILKNIKNLIIDYELNIPDNLIKIIPINFYSYIQNRLYKKVGVCEGSYVLSGNTIKYLNLPSLFISIKTIINLDMIKISKISTVLISSKNGEYTAGITFYKLPYGVSPDSLSIIDEFRNSFLSDLILSGFLFINEISKNNHETCFFDGDNYDVAIDHSIDYAFKSSLVIIRFDIYKEVTSQEYKYKINQIRELL
ncbi:MAG: hypothetical protein ACTSRP_15680 [Candidatus Helarchaeota archaeon]